MEPKLAQVGRLNQWLQPPVQVTVLWYVIFIKTKLFRWNVIKNCINLKFDFYNVLYEGHLVSKEKNG